MIYAPLALYLLFTLVPFYWILLFSLRPAGSTSVVPWPITFEHYKTVWDGAGFAVFFKNSVIIALFTLFGTTVLSLLGGYALARFRFRGRGAFMVMTLCTQFIPGAMMLIPLFDIFRTIGLINTPWSIVVADTVFGLPLSLIMMAGFIRNIPIELEEASWVDGCGRLRGFLTVVLPLLRPGMVATRADKADMLRAMSSASWMTRLALMPLAGSSSYMVTTGPGRTSTMSPRTWKSSSTDSSRRALRSSPARSICCFPFSGARARRSSVGSW